MQAESFSVATGSEGEELTPLQLLAAPGQHVTSSDDLITLDKKLADVDQLTKKAI